MKLITKELEKRFAEVGDQSQSSNPLIIAKFFAPSHSATWYATELDVENQICFGYVTGLAFDEWGSFSIQELESLQLPFGLHVERDRFFKEIRFKELIKEHEQSNNLEH
ncbi:DUF2958 domain-containing protein [Chryseobacterium oryctis]|uniref:DUF2958 domain-containing protein n=1 Tax=Chryseobacterium oryctis TaxID=2952618 RepID=A0ABT3HS71_9FLAO|nr:DUF2958 domain-containing protein [Chryseobacterium oryctis]MCW3162637.1 DUF2958 domain-containing protein [Chryseobacterium oryctis]